MMGYRFSMTLQLLLLLLVQDWLVRAQVIVGVVYLKQLKTKTHLTITRLFLLAWASCNVWELKYTVDRAPTIYNLFHFWLENILVECMFKFDEELR